MVKRTATPLINTIVKLRFIIFNKKGRSHSAEIYNSLGRPDALGLVDSSRIMRRIR
ncbi:MAG: hypothetical protein ACI9Q9_000354 [Flavobacterium sp.]|jgi:hypothetical protein